MDDNDFLHHPHPKTLSMETQTNTVLEVHIKGKKFSWILKVLSVSLHLACFEFLGEEELHIQASTHTKISMADIFLSLKKLNSFHCDHSLSFELNNLHALDRALKETGDDDILMFTADYDALMFCIMTESPLQNSW